MKYNKGFTLLEIILAISLILLITLSMSFLFSTAFVSSINNNNNTIALQELDNLETYIKNELTKDNVSIENINSLDYILEYKIFLSQFPIYIISDKKLRFIKEQNSIIVTTHNKYYSKDKDNLIFLYENSPVNNILSENVKDIKLHKEDDKLYFNIVKYENNVEKSTTFHINDIHKEI